MLNKIREASRNLIIPFSFILPAFILYTLNPNSFEFVWKGRAPLLLFLWLLSLELVLGWKKLLNRRIAWTRVRIAAVTVTAAAPTIYVISTFLFGLDAYILQLGKLVGVPYQRYGLWFLEESWPLSLEYLFFTALFIVSVWLMYQIDGLKRFSISLFFLGAMSFFYMIDTFYPYGKVVALQAFVPVTGSSVVQVLNWMGYKAQLASYTIMGMTVLLVPGLPTRLVIGWPSSGAHSLIIYTFVILLFLKGAPFSLRKEIIRAAIPKRLKFMARSKRIDFLQKRKIIRAAIMAGEKFVVDFFRMVPFYIIVGIGAVGTFIVNVLRIVTIVIIGVNVGMEALDLFHNYYGELYFIAWIIIYPLTIIYSRKIWTRLSMLGGKN